LERRGEGEKRKIFIFIIKKGGGGEGYNFICTHFIFLFIDPRWYKHHIRPRENKYTHYLFLFIVVRKRRE
jgi:hypothetical protein